jgi:hypothetical protein
MDYKKHLCTASVIAAALILSGCASAPGTRVALMPLQDLENFVVDCNNKDEQIALLKRQIPNPAWRITNYQIVNSTGGAIYSMADGTYAERRSHAQGWNQAVARRKINYLETWCQTKK